MSVYILAIAAAALLGIGSVVQHRAACQASSRDVLSVRLVFWLVRRPLWLGGAGVSTMGNVMSATALGMGSVALVQPLLVTRLLFALPLAAAWLRRSLSARDWKAALATAAGLAMFVVGGQPHQGERLAVPDAQWLLAGGLVVGVAVVLAAAGRRLVARWQAPVLATAAGMLYALQATLTHTLISEMRAHGVLHLALTWYPYAAVGLAVFSTILIQSAFRIAPLPASYPAVVVAEPLVGIALAFGIQGAALRLGSLPLAIALTGIVIMMIGVYRLASSPLVTGHPDDDADTRAGHLPAQWWPRVRRGLERLSSSALAPQPTSTSTRPPRRRAAQVPAD